MLELKVDGLLYRLRRVIKRGRIAGYKLSVVGYNEIGEIDTHELVEDIKEAILYAVCDECGGTGKQWHGLHDDIKEKRCVECRGTGKNKNK